MDIVLIYTNAKIRRMSERRQKIALAKRPKKILKGCYPMSVSEIKTDNAMATFDVTFQYSPT